MPMQTIKTLLCTTCCWVSLVLAGPTPVADLYDELSRAALDGDDVAAFELATNLETCFINRRVLTDQVIDVTLENARSASTVAAQQSLERLATRYGNLKTYCEGLSKDEMESGIEWLFLAAESGHEGALVLLHQTVKSRVEPPSPKLQQYAQQALNLLKNEVDKGNGSFTMTLANVYDQGTIVARDSVPAAAYAYAFQLVGDSATGGRMLESIIARHALVDAEINQAKAMGRRIAICCTKEG